MIHERHVETIGKLSHRDDDAMLWMESCESTFDGFRRTYTFVQNVPPRALERLADVCWKAYVPKSYKSINCQLILAQIHVEGFGWVRNSSRGTL
jgi:hypothetical protein